jgi:subtilisin family serine protease
MAKAIRSAVDQGATVINMSMGSTSDSGQDCDPVLQNAVDHALKRDAVIVAAAGNTASGGNFSAQPAGCAGVLAVGAVGKQGRPAEFSLRQPYVSIAAPGTDMLSLMTDSIDQKGYLEESQGTSYAAGLVSGVVALLRSRYPQSAAKEILRRVTGTAQDIGQKGHDDRTGYGIIQPHKALTTTTVRSVTSPVYERWEKSLRERPVNALPAPEKEIVPDVVPLRTRAIQIGLVVAVGILVGGSVFIVLALLRRRSRSKDVQRTALVRSDASVGNTHGRDCD